MAIKLFFKIDNIFTLMINYLLSSGAVFVVGVILTIEAGPGRSILCRSILVFNF